MPSLKRKETIAVVGIVTVICAALYPTVVAPTLVASQRKQDKLEKKVDAGFVKKGMWTEMKHKTDKSA